MQYTQKRALMAAEQQREQPLRQQHEVFQGKYHEAIKDNPCVAERMHDAVVKLLQQNVTCSAANRPVTP